MYSVSRSLGVVRLITAVAFASASVTSAVRAQEGAAGGDSALARAVTSARVSLARGLSAASARGRPISAKYELEDGKLQLSVYTEKGGKFWEVIVDHRTGRIAEAREIKDGEDLTAAKSQSETMSKAKRSLNAAVTRALHANRGYHAVSVMPSVSDGHPVATIVVARGTASKTVSEPLS